MKVSILKGSLLCLLIFLKAKKHLQIIEIDIDFVQK